MAITVTESPSTYSLAKTEVKIGLQTDDLFISTGTKALFVIRWTDGFFPVQNETMTVTFGSTELDFIFKDTPDDSGLQLQSGVGSPSNYGLLLTQSLKRNFTLLENFNISAAYDGSDIDITLESIEKIEFGTFTLTGTVTGLTFATQTDGSTPEKNSNFRILLDVYKEATLYSQELELIQQLSGIPDSNGDVDFDLSPALQNIVSTPFPNIGTTILSTAPMSNYITEVDGALKRFHLRYCEQYGLTPASKVFLGWPGDDEVTQDLYAFCLNAGINNVDRPTFNSSFETNYLSTVGRKFLTRRTLTNVLATKQTKLIFDGLSHTDTVFKAAIYLYYTDGTNSYHVLGKYTKASSVNRIMRFHLGYNDLQLDTLKDAGKTVSYYYAYILDNGGSNQLFERITVYVIPNKKFEKYFLFENSLGGIDTLYTFGVFDFKLNFQNQLTQNYSVDPSNGIYNGEFSETSNRTQEVFELNTGFVSKDYLNYLKDFMYSKKKYLVDGSKLVKVNIPNQSIKLYNDREQAFGLNIDLQKSWFEKTL
jgi:hypothetical protein